jgi:O-antigen/teichoic acid export membrane protein
MERIRTWVRRYLKALPSAPSLPGLRDRIVNGVSWTFTGAVIGRTVSLVGIIVATRLLPASAFGQLSAVQLLVTTCAGVVGLGLGVAVTKRIAESRAREPELVWDYASAATRLVSVSGVVGTVAVFLGRGSLATGWLHDPALSYSIALASAMVLTSALFAVQIGILTGFEAFKESAFATSARSILTAVLLVVGISLAGLNGGLLGYLVGEVAATTWAMVVVSRLGGADARRVFRLGRGAAGTWRSLRKIGIPAVAATVAILLSLLLGQRMLTELPNGFVAVAQFSIAYRWSLVVLFVPAAVAPVMLPLLANLVGAGRHGAFGRLLRGNLLILSMITAVPALIMILARGPILGLSGAAYRSDPLPFVLLLVATIPVAWNTILSQAALALEAISAWLVSDLVLAATLVASASVLIPRYRSAGLAVAYLLAYAATCVVLMLPVRSRLRATRSVA